MPRSSWENPVARMSHIWHTSRDTAIASPTPIHCSQILWGPRAIHVRSGTAGMSPIRCLSAPAPRMVPAVLHQLCSMRPQQPRARWVLIADCNLPHRGMELPRRRGGLLEAAPAPLRAGAQPGNRRWQAPPSGRRGAWQDPATVSHGVQDDCCELLQHQLWCPATPNVVRDVTG